MMKTVAFIPMRGGSKAIPSKNIREIAGKPLAHWVIEAALNCNLIDEVVISTDSADIKNCCSQLSSKKLLFFDRSPLTATDTASTESALLEFLGTSLADTVVLIQATSPMLSSADLENALQYYRDQKYDSLVSVVRQRRFIWNQDSSGSTPVNYDPFKRPRRQNFDGYLVENGAFYISGRSQILSSGCRISGKVDCIEMDELTYIELDEQRDWIIVEQLLLERKRNISKSRLKKIKYFFCDVDGVLTDAGMYYSEHGDELKKFNTRDGMGLKLLSKLGIKIGILTSEETSLVARRGAKLNLDFIFQGIKNKAEFIVKFCEENGLEIDEIAYIGDDINDFDLLKIVGFSACPIDAIEKNKEICNFVCSKRGGEGCVREVIDHILKIS